MDITELYMFSLFKRCVHAVIWAGADWMMRSHWTSVKGCSSRHRHAGGIQTLSQTEKEDEFWSSDHWSQISVEVRTTKAVFKLQNMERNMTIYRRTEDLQRKVKVKDHVEAGREREMTLAPDCLGLESVSTKHGLWMSWLDQSVPSLSFCISLGQF